jgi:hypothetical protein
MERSNIVVVQAASNPSQVLQQFVAFAEEQGGSLALSVRNAIDRIADPRDRLDEVIWQFKVHAPEGYTLNAATGSPILSNYFWLPMIFDH